jgi:pimeloyl-ACP methyl ester carboxylesterase
LSAQPGYSETNNYRQSIRIGEQMNKVLSLVFVGVLVILGIGYSNPSPVAAQGPYETVTVEAEDGLELVGWYAGPDMIETDEELVPAVLLQHHGSSSKEKWFDFIEPLLEAKYAVLAVDLRGHGETGGRGDQAPTPELWDQDTMTWLAWLREQPGIDPDRVSLVGASIGGDIGLNVAALDESLVTIVVISGGLDVLGITTADAVAELTQPVYFISSLGDEPGMEAFNGWMSVVQTEALFRVYEGSMCCTFLVQFEPDLGPSIIEWLDRYNR